MPVSPTPARIAARHERSESVRLDNFVDGAFAFAITLLIISGGSLPKSSMELEHALRGVPAFAACFAQLALFWHGHVRWRDMLRLTDGPSLRLSLLLVFFALIFVFPLHLVFSAFFFGVTGGVLSPDFQFGGRVVPSMTALFVCYGLSYTCMAGTLALLLRHGVRKARLAREDAVAARISLRVWSFAAAVGLLSAMLALCLSATGSAALIGFVSGSAYALLGLRGVLASRYRKLLETRLPP